MKKVKIGLWVMLLFFIVLFFYQNKDLLMESNSLNYGLPFFKLHHGPELPNAILFLFSFLIGLLGTYFFSLSISSLRKEVELLQGGSSKSDTDSKEQNTEPKE